MSVVKQTIIPVLLAAVWISISEFVRNQFLLHTFWIDHYKHMGLEFPEKPLNGGIWGVWSLLFAVLIFLLTKKCSLLQTIMLSWFSGFVMMWVVIGNLGVLPFGVLPITVPLSALETAVAAYIVKKLS